MPVDDRLLRTVRGVLERHDISEAWLLASDASELVVMIEAEDLGRVNKRQLTTELIDVTSPTRKVWLEAKQLTVIVQGVIHSLELTPVFNDRPDAASP